MQTIKQLLDAKGRDVHSIHPDATVYEAIEVMADKGIGALIVLHDEELAGILSERDYARKMILQGRTSRETRVSDIMTDTVITGSESWSVEQCMSLMTEKHIRHLPIITSNQITGMVSLGDLVKSRLEEQEFLIEQLEHYIKQ